MMTIIRLIIAVDSTGIKVTNRGQWMHDKWNAQNKKKGYLKIHVAVNIKTKEILASEITDRDSTIRVLLLKSNLFWPMVRMIPTRISNALRKTKFSLKSR